MDVQLTDTDAKAYKDKDLFKVLESVENSKSESLHNRALTSDNNSRPCSFS
jgi:hypothetical protein